MLQLAGTVTNDGPTPYTIWFNPDRIDQVKAKYAAKGAILKIGKAVPMEPAAASTATVSFFKSEGTKYEQSERKPKLTASGELKTSGGRRASQLKPVICTTTNKQFPCTTDAALEYNLSPASVSAHLNHPEKHKQVKGYRFAYVNPADKKLSIHA